MNIKVIIEKKEDLEMNNLKRKIKLKTLSVKLKSDPQYMNSYTTLEYYERPNYERIYKNKKYPKNKGDRSRIKTLLKKEQIERPITMSELFDDNYNINEIRKRPIDPKTIQSLKCLGIIIDEEI